MTRTRLPAEARRLSLQDAAEHELLQHGYAATRLDDIARAAGVSRQLLQRHFPTKSALYRSLLDRHRDGLLAIVAQTVAGDDHESLRAAARSWFGYVEQYPFVAAFLFDDATGDPVNAQRHTQMRDTARQAVRRALATALSAHFSDSEVEAIAEMVRSSVVGLARWHATNRHLSADQVADLAVDMWLRATGVR